MDNRYLLNMPDRIAFDQHPHVYVVSYPIKQFIESHHPPEDFNYQILPSLLHYFFTIVLKELCYYLNHTPMRVRNYKQCMGFALGYENGEYGITSQLQSYLQTQFNPPLPHSAIELYLLAIFQIINVSESLFYSLFDQSIPLYKLDLMMHLDEILIQGDTFIFYFTYTQERYNG